VRISDLKLVFLCSWLYLCKDPKIKKNNNKNVILQLKSIEDGGVRTREAVWDRLLLSQYSDSMAWNNRMIDELESMRKEAVFPDRSTVPEFTWMHQGKSR
jgi:hypothetical protein